MFISIDAEKVSDKMQHLFIIKKSQKTSYREEFHNLKKNIYKTLQIISYCKKKKKKEKTGIKIRKGKKYPSLEMT